MIIACISDTHRQLNKVMVVEADVLVHAGDFMGQGKNMAELNSELYCLIERFPHKHIVFIAGNHDRIFERQPDYTRSQIEHFNRLSGGRLHYLQDDAVVIDGVKFYGAPWTPNFDNWAFMPERGSEELARCWQRIPDDVDVLVTHGPGMGTLDVPGHPWKLDEHGNIRRVGCELLRDELKRIKPAVHVFGHIHGSYGVLNQGGVIYVNAATCDEDYVPSREPIMVGLSKEEGKVVAKRERLYRQCRLRRRLGEDRYMHTVTWLPLKYAVKGKVVKLRDADNAWVDGWRVTEASETPRAIHPKGDHKKLFPSIYRDLEKKERDRDGRVKGQPE